MPNIPPEIISIIVGFAADTDEWTLRLLSLVSRTWLTASRRELFQRRNFVINVNKSQKISNPLDILQSRDRLPNLPHILSFISNVTLKLPDECSESAYYPEQTFTLLDNLANRREFFQPKTLCITGNPYLTFYSKGCPSHPSCLMTAISETFSTITHLQLNIPPAVDCCSNLNYLPFSLGKLQAISTMRWDIASFNKGVVGDGSLCIYRLPEGLHTFEYDLIYGIRNHYLQRTLDWLRSHPPLRQMRRLSLRGAVPDNCTLAQGFINMCPNLDILCIFHQVNLEDTVHAPGSGLDLSRHKRLDRLCLYIPESPYDGGEAFLKTVLLTVQTATSLSGILDIVADATHFRTSSMIHLWHSLSEAIAILPQGVVLKLRVVCSNELEFEKAENIIWSIFGNLSKHRNVLFRIEDSAPRSIWPSSWDFFKIVDKSTWNTLEVE